MSLNWSMKKCKPGLMSHPMDAERMHPVSEVMIWRTMAVDLGAITEKNVEEWVFRNRLLQVLDGADLSYNDGTEVFLTEQDIRDHIGLETNVSDLTRPQWLAKKFGKDSRYALPKLKQDQSAREMLAARYEAIKATQV